MIYADYNFYLMDYKGTVIPDAVTYDEVSVDASAYIDYLTHNRIKVDELPTWVIEKVKMAACAVAEIYFKQRKDEDGGKVASESVGNHSKSFAVVQVGYEQRTHQKLSRAKMYLHGTGLLYGGLR